MQLTLSLTGSGNAELSSMRPKGNLSQVRVRVTFIYLYLASDTKGILAKEDLGST